MKHKEEIDLAIQQHIQGNALHIKSRKPANTDMADTVIITSILDDCDTRTRKEICNYAIRHARKRIIVVAKTLSISSFDLYSLLGYMKLSKICNDKYWLAIIDVRK